MSIHRINLRGPWEFRWLTPPNDNKPRTGTVKLPSVWQVTLSKSSGLVMFTRKFGTPTNLEDHSTVLLTFDAVGGNGTVKLNDQFLGILWSSQEQQSFDVTELLEPRNLLEVSVNFAQDGTSYQPGGLYGYVGLDIIEPDVGDPSNEETLPL